MTGGAGAVLVVMWFVCVCRGPARAVGSNASRLDPLRVLAAVTWPSSSQAVSAFVCGVVCVVNVGAT